ncbi:hypothetical protein [Fulvimarina manganoxydans]|uniref:hypothetical protein n=1 Tax=Fulvimarina manganoxydans TaxID=937218 RepID=UPI00313E234C
MAFDFAAAERVKRIDPGRTLARRRDDALPFLGHTAFAGGPLLLDTCVYLDQMKGTAPDAVDRLADIRIVNHLMVAVQELIFAIGFLSEDDPRMPNVKAAIKRIVEAMPRHRLFVPDADVMGRPPSLPASSPERRAMPRTIGPRRSTTAPCSCRRKSSA